MILYSILFFFFFFGWSRKKITMSQNWFWNIYWLYIHKYVKSLSLWYVLLKIVNQIISSWISVVIFDSGICVTQSKHWQFPRDLCSLLWLNQLSKQNIFTTWCFIKGTEQGIGRSEKQVQSFWVDWNLLNLRLSSLCIRLNIRTSEDNAWHKANICWIPTINLQSNFTYTISSRISPAWHYWLFWAR